MDLTKLEKIIAKRLQTQKSNSYTVRLSQQGVARVGKKFGEEAVEALIEGIQGNRQPFISESADMLYHWLLLLKMNHLDVESVYQELDSRYQERQNKTDGI